MVGKHHIEIANKRAKYILDIDRKVTVIKGNSGTGKTTLIRMLQGYLDQGNKSGIVLKNDTNIPLMVFTPTTRWENYFIEMHGTIIFVDEVVDYIYSKGFQQEFIKSDNYLVVISRSGKFNHLPYAISSIYELRTEMNEKVKLTKMYKLYTYYERSNTPTLIMTEDSNSGAQMIKNIFNVPIISANGNGNVSKKIVKYITTQSVIFIVVDGAAFGGFISQLMNIATLNNDIFVFAPESFEFLLLQTNQMRRKLSDEIDHTWKYCDISQYLTWEQYYTDLLQKLCLIEYGSSYSKSQLHESFLNKDIMDQVKKNLYLNLVKETDK